MQRPQVDLAVKRRLQRVRVPIRVFYAKCSANNLKASALCAGGGKLPPPAPTPLVGPTNLQILATPLVLISSFSSRQFFAEWTKCHIVLFCNLIGTARARHQKSTTFPTDVRLAPQRSTVVYFAHVCVKWSSVLVSPGFSLELCDKWCMMYYWAYVDLMSLLFTHHC